MTGRRARLLGAILAGACLAGPPARAADAAAGFIRRIEVTRVGKFVDSL